VLRLVLPALAVAAIGTATVAASLPEAAPARSASSAISLPAPQVETSAVPVPTRVAPISRAAERVRLEAKPTVEGHLFAVSAVNIRKEPDEGSKRVGALEFADKIGISGETRGKWVEVVIDEVGYWVHSDFLAEKKPEPPTEEVEEAEEAAPEPAAEVASAPCAGSSVESGLGANAIAVHRAVCGAFPQVTSYGGLRPGDSGEHGSGRALDIMISGSTGWDIAEYVRANAGSLGVSEVIYSQKIWTVERGGEGWRYMEDRGSTTANHYDHVHVTTY
jgi:hypothetical protein